MAKSTKLRVVPSSKDEDRPEASPASDELFRLGMGLYSSEEAVEDDDRELFDSWFPGDPEKAKRVGPRFKDVIYQILAATVDVGDDAPQFLAALREFIERKLPQPQSSKVPSPKSAPALWKDRDLSDETNPALFTRTTYERWLGRGLTRQHLRELDPDLYRALSVWEHRHPEDRITELPTLAEVIDARIAALADEFSPDELRKLGSTLQTRHRRSKK